MNENIKEFQISQEEKTLLIKISRETLYSFVRNRDILSINASNYNGILIEKQIGAFVTLYNNDRLRGCIGRFHPDEELYKVIIDLTIASCSRDTRFEPVTIDEIDNIKIEISVLSPIIKINSIDEFELGKHGLIIRKNGHSGTYLPKVAEDTKWSKEEFVGHCSRDKAGIGWEGWKTADLFVYTALLIKED